MFPNITFYEPLCLTEILKIVGSPSSTESHMTEFESLNPASQEAIPSDINRHAIYEFYLVIQAYGGETYLSDMYTLVVGCVDIHLNKWQNPSLRTSTILFLGHQKENAYRFEDPLSDISYCQVTSNSVHNATYNSELNDTAVQLAKACSPGAKCNNIDLIETEKCGTYKFVIKSVFGRNPVVYLDSSEILVSLVCSEE